MRGRCRPSAVLAHFALLAIAISLFAPRAHAKSLKLAIDDARVSKSGIYASAFDMSALIPDRRELGLNKADLNPANEGLRTSFIRTQYPHASRGIAHVRPCFLACNSTFSTPWRVNTRAEENAVLARMLAEHIPGYCVDNNSCLYTATRDLVIHATRAPVTPSPSIYVPRPLDGYPTIELDLSPESPLWKSGRYRGYVLTDKRLVLLSKEEQEEGTELATSSSSSSGTTTLAQLRSLHRKTSRGAVDGEYTVDDWYLSFLTYVALDPRSMCTVALDNSGTPALCLSPHAEQNVVPLRAAVDESTGQMRKRVGLATPLQNATVIGARDNVGARITWTHKRYSLQQQQQQQQQANNDNNMAGSFIVGRTGISDNVESIVYLHSKEHPVMALVLAPTDSVVPVVGWARAIFIILAAGLFFRRNLSTGIEVRYALRQLFYLRAAHLFSSRKQPRSVHHGGYSPGARARFAPSDAPENRIHFGALLADFMLDILAIGATIAYIVAAISQEFYFPRYAAYIYFSALSGAALVIHVSAAIYATWKGSAALVARNKDDIADSSAAKPRRSGGGTAVLREFYMHTALSFTSRLRRQTPTPPSASSSAHPAHISAWHNCIIRAAGNQVTFAAIAYLLWWNTDNAFDWGVLSVIIGLSISFLAYHCLEILTIAVCDMCASSEGLTPGRTRTHHLRQLGHFAIAAAAAGAAFGLYIPQIIAPYAAWLAPYDIDDTTVYYLTWILILPSVVCTICLHLRGIVEEETSRSTALMQKLL